ncbi:hypothetical protein ACQ7DA_16890 [Zafaria sp. J156]|uniref:hypothetical protein n=1 Tax=Zafaria sp. J156 TaxID=3116490 RepID=UPI002E78DC6B|nr:hypothetical protein [Zafaria sp. J156]MEE1622961.1 hypothetical protein [Zafaria sp. J156]
MSIEVKMDWLATLGLDTEPQCGKLFNSSVHQRLFGQFDIRDEFAVAPVRYLLTAGTHEWATRRLFDGHTCRRLPYPRISIQGIDLEVCDITISLFPTDIAVARISAKAHLVGSGELERDLAALQRLRASKDIPEIRTLFDLLFARLAGLGAQPVRRNYKGFFIGEIQIPNHSDVFTRLVEDHGRDVVALLIGTSEPSSLQQDLIQRVLASNEDLNTKSKDDLMLLNRKGAIILRPAGHYRGPHAHRLSRTRDLAVINQFALKFLSDYGASAVRVDHSSATILSKLTKWVDQPELIFYSSVSQTNVWKTLSRATLLHNFVDAANSAR